jgi:hypothetical protein
VLRVPRAHVQQAIGRLSALGTIVGEQVDIQDLQAGINATDRTIARLQRQLAGLRAEPQTDAVKRRIAALTARVVALQRARASTLQAAHFATVRLSLSSSAAPKRHTHYLRDALPWLGGAASSCSCCLRCGCCGGCARTRCSGALELREHPEGRLADGQLRELRVDAAELAAARRVGLLDLRLAHRQRAALCADRAEAGERASAAASISTSISTS